MPTSTNRPLPPGRAPALAALLLGALLGGCGAQEERFPPACPGLALLPDAADITRFNGQGRDLSNLVISGHIRAVPAVCKPGDKPTTVVATLHVEADMTLGPAAAGVQNVKYFIALLQGDKVVGEQDFSYAPSFAANVSRTSIKGEDIEVIVPVSKTVSAAAYRIFVGFRLSPEELAYNRTHLNPS